MTTNFDRFCQCITEMNDFSELVHLNRPPCGFWITPNGKYYTVKEFEHSVVAMHIINNSSVLKDDFKSASDDPVNFLAKHQFVRVVAEPFNKKLYADKYFVKPLKNNSLSYITFEPSNAAKRIIKDIAILFDLECEYLNK